MAAAPVFSGASAPVELGPPRLRSSVLVLVGLVLDEVRVRVGDDMVPLVLLRVVGSPVPKLVRVMVLFIGGAAVLYIA